MSPHILDAVPRLSRLLARLVFGLVSSYRKRYSNRNAVVIRLTGLKTHGRFFFLHRLHGCSLSHFSCNTKVTRQEEKRTPLLFGSSGMSAFW